MMWDQGTGDWLWMGLWMLIIWGGLAAVVLLAIRTLWHGSDRGEAKGSDARSILAERYARGEISQDEFERMEHVLDHRAA